MKKNISETFTRMQIAQVAIAYSNGFYTYHNFVQQYPSCSQHNFYTLLHLAVDKQIVSEQVARRIQSVAVAGSTQKAKDSGYDSDYVTRIGCRIYNSWERRIESARYFSFSRKDAKKLIEHYAESKLSKSEFCKVNCLSVKLFENTLIDSVIYNWISDSCFDQLYEKSIRSGNNPERVEHLFYQLTKRRAENKMSKKKP